MNTKNTILSILAIVIIVAGGSFYLNKTSVQISKTNNSKSIDNTKTNLVQIVENIEPQTQTDQESKVQQENKPEELKNQGTGKIVENNEVPKQAIQPGKYIPYSEGLSSVSQSDIKTILFFNASWCPSCRSVDKNIESNIDKISNNLQILNIDYDSNQELRQKYGVTSQHTFVLIDNKGNEMKKIIGLDTIEDINNFIQ